MDRYGWVRIAFGLEEQTERRGWLHGKDDETGIACARVRVRLRV